MIEIYYEVHSEVDGHVSGSYDKEHAAQRVETLTDRTEHNHYIVEREEAV